MFTTLLLTAIISGLSLFCSLAKANNFPTSGDPDIDRIRAEVRVTPTGAGNFKLRGFLMKQWLITLQQQGADLEDYLPVDDRMHQLVYYNTLFQDGKPQEFKPEQLKELTSVIDQGYRILERKQQEVAEGKASHVAVEAKEKPTTQAKAPDKLIPWPNYKGNPQRTGYTGAPGPQLGQTAWKFPVGLAWESRPVIENARVYVASPGMRSILHCLDIETGEPVWISRQEVELVGDQLYCTPAISSSPVVSGNRILVRQMGSRGNHGLSRYVVKIDKESGQILGQIEAGHVDYRAGYAAFAANENYIVMPHGVQDIEATPPTAQGFNRIICRDAANGNLLWDFNIGPTFAEPVIEGRRIWAATRSGYVYCLKADGQLPPPSDERIAWQFKAAGAVNRAVTVFDNAVYFGANDGFVYCLDRETGALRWKQSVATAEPRAFRQFSTPLVHNDRVYIGGADNHLYCLNAVTGLAVFRWPADDWVRSRPVAMGDHVFFASLKGTLQAVKVSGDRPSLAWSLALGEHPVYADLAAAEGRILVNTSDLFTYCVTADGKIAWRRGLLAGFEKNGMYIPTELIAGGAYFQSKPTAADGLMFFGTPSRFVYALNAETGKEIWKFELGAAVSGAPEYYKGRIYIGQQGGENDFYCLEAKTGKPVWSQSVGWVWGSPCVDGGQVFIPEIEGWAHCLEAETGVIVWRYRTERSLCTEPFVDDDTVYFGGWDYYLYAFDRRSGDLRFKKQLGGGSDSGVPTIVDGRIYLPCGSGQFRCLDAATGETLWRFKMTNAVFNVSPAYHNGRVYISIMHGQGMGGIPVVSKVVALDAATGEQLWSHFGGGLTGPVIGFDGRVFIASTCSPLLYCLDGQGNKDGTAKLLWAYRMGGKVEESVPCLYGNHLYILSCDGYLHAVK